MPKAKKKKGPEAMAALARMPDVTARRGMPALDSVVALTPAGPTSKYTIIHTNEVDVYEEGALGPGRAGILPSAPAGDNFKGTARKASKLSLSDAQIERFKDVKDLIATLPAHDKMVKHKPKITTTASSKRVTEEERNIGVTAFMYAASREDDNDYHLIIGRAPSATEEMYMTMELSGLPPQDSPSFKKLKGARDAFKKFFKDIGASLPGLTYDFYQPPISVRIEGSLFFDMSHAKGSRPGPASLKSRMPVVWEVHPISKMTLK
jgi:hypothetical protein